MTLFAGGGECGELLRQIDWSQTALGPVEGWSQSLRTCVRVVLTSRQPMFVWWGEQLINLYNDAYRSILGGKHPVALGQPASVVWREIWDQVEPRATSAMRANEGTYDEALLLIMERHGYREETYYTFSYSPVPDDDGAISGILCANTDETRRIVGERQIGLLHELAARATEARTDRDAAIAAAGALATNPRDLPFALIYLEDGDGAPQLAARTGFDDAAAAAPAVSWPIAEVVEAHATQVVALPPGAWPRGAWDTAPTHAAVVGIPGTDRHGALVVGINPCRLFDADYRRFLELVGVQIGSSIDAARALEEQVRRTEELAALDRAKTAFFANVSHEFRTPLTLMLGPTEDAMASPERALRGEALATVHRNELRLLKLVNTLLEFARSEAGRAQAVYRPTDLAALTATIASTFHSTVERAGLTYEIDCPPLPAAVEVDRALWETIVLNLVSNAFKFTFEGRILVEQRAAGDHVELTVTDTGTGIADSELPRIFERFHRVEGARGRTHEGSGIGLALVRELVGLHGGSVDVASELGRGTTFTVRVPYAVAGRSAAADLREPDEAARRSAGYVDEAARWSMPATDPAPVVVAPAAANASPTGPRPHILLADDNRDMRDYLHGLLAAHWDVTAVADGAAALAAAHVGAFDLVLSDVMMPLLDGFGLLAALRASPATRDLPVIMVSARAGDEARVEGLQAGADDYLVKPFAARELIARVRIHLELAAARRRAQEAEARLRLALEAASTATWRLDPRTRTVTHDGRYASLLGLPAGETTTSLDALLAWIHPDHRPQVSELLETADRLDIEVQIAPPGEPRGADGRELATTAPRWLRLVGRAIGEGPNRYLTGAATDVSEHHALLAQVEGASRAKDEFLAMLGHELRNPLAPISTALQLVRDRGGEISREQVIIERQVTHLTQLVDDLLDIARITRGKVELRRSPIELEAVVARAIEIAAPLLDQRGHHLEVATAGGPYVVDGDPMRLSQVAANLLTNAAKYTPKGGHIQVSLRRDPDGAIVLAVADDGVGIDPALLPHVFDLFVQGTRTTDRHDGGLGLGLALVNNLVRLHDGEVSARSAGRGAGSTFEVRLPAHRPAEAPPPAIARVPTPMPTPAPAPRGRRVLVVDDNVDAAEMLAMILRSHHHQVEVAHDGPQALATLEQFTPDVAVLDLGLPVMDGFELAQRLRSHPALTGCTLIALTGYGQPDDRRRTASAGFATHLVKPVGVAQLLAAINTTP